MTVDMTGEWRDLAPIDQARLVATMMEDFGWTQTKIAEQLGLAQSTIANKLRLLKLPEEQQAQMDKGMLSERRALSLLGRPADQMLSIAEREMGYRFVYFIGCDEVPCWKIGISLTPSSRLRDLQVASPFTLTLVMAIKTVYFEEVEQWLHARFRGRRMNGEWFHISWEQIEHMVPRIPMRDTDPDWREIMLHTG